MVVIVNNTCNKVGYSLLAGLLFMESGSLVDCLSQAVATILKPCQPR